MEGNLRTLIVEDSEDDALLLVRQLTQGGYTLDWRRVDTPDALTDALDSGFWDIVFADYSMPHFSGTHALTLVRERGLDIPFIFVSGTIGEDTAVDAMRAGANDYIMKGNRKRLLPAVERELREALLRSERRRAEQELQLLQGVSQTAAAAGDVYAALSVTLSKVCETAGWRLAQAWMPREDGAAIECCPAWHCRGSGLEKFRAASQSFAFAPGEELPGRVWLSRQPLWLEDVTEEHQFARAVFARETGLKAALAVPVLAGAEVLTVLEFFLGESRAEDERLVKLVGAVAEQLGSVIQRKRAEERLQYLAHYDALTGLPNRVLFIDRLKQAIHEANRHERIVGVALLDLDRFKTINDSLGHGIGDLLIKATAERLLRSVRDGDTVARLAGDEFTIILADMGQADHAAQVAKKILINLAQPFHIAGNELFTSGSVGITLYPFDDSGVDGLLRNADIAMYRAKDQGGNSYQYYSADMTSKARERLSLENDLRRAIEREEFVLHYQPIVSLREGAPVSVEALVRWNHPQRGLLPPAEFIALAEEAGLIAPLGEWVLRRAVQDSARLSRSGFPWLRVAVNISAHQFRQHELVRILLRMLATAGVQATQLQLEITESVLMQNMEATAVALRALSEAGVELSLDDFGTGYSSLSYLKRFPIDVLKIDRSFVRDIPDDVDDSAIAGAIISMAHNLGIQVIAEGVETRAQIEFLRAHDCDNAQGYLIGTPQPADELMQLLRRKSVLLEP